MLTVGRGNHETTGSWARRLQAAMASSDGAGSDQLNEVKKASDHGNIGHVPGHDGAARFGAIRKPTYTAHSNHVAGISLRDISVFVCRCPSIPLCFPFVTYLL